MGNLNMEATQIHYRHDSSMTVDKKLQNLEGRVSTLEDGEPAEVSKADIAPVFSAETAYSAGDYVYHDGHLYKFTADHAVGTWSDQDTEHAVVTADLTEQAEDIDQLKSGLTNYELQNNINLEVPNRKNLAGNPYGVMLNSSGVFVSANVRSYIIPTNLGTITISVDDITKISDDVIRIGYCDDIPAESGTGIRVSSMTTNTYTITPNTGYKYIVVSNLLDNDYGWQDIQIELGSTATSYTPYIPSVDSRIEAVESGLSNLIKKYEQENVSTGATGYIVTNYDYETVYKVKVKRHSDGIPYYTLLRASTQGRCVVLVVNDTLTAETNQNVDITIYAISNA